MQSGGGRLGAGEFSDLGGRINKNRQKVHLDSNKRLLCYAIKNLSCKNV